ncbi:molecular chaperone, partial [Citrobacter farmeri]|nr:molecular chaperone [Citrobacter farmeri]
NPTPYYVTIVTAAAAQKGAEIASFKPVMVEPRGSISLGISASALGISASALGSQPVLAFINDFGGRPKLVFSCSNSTCSVSSVIAG